MSWKQKKCWVFLVSSRVWIAWGKYRLRRRQWQPSPVLLPGKSHGWRSLVGCSLWGNKESDMTEWLHFHALEKEMATHSSVLGWRIPGTGEPGGLPSMGWHRVGHDWSNLAAAAAYRLSEWLRAKSAVASINFAAAANLYKEEETP